MENKPEILPQNTEDKKIFIKTYGCQMNFYDSEKMGDMMGAQGFAKSDDMDSDLIVLNTCHIREKASEKMYSDLGRILKVKNKRKEQGKNTVIAVAGCVAQAEGSEIKERAKYVDIVVGPQSYQRLPELVKNAEAGAKNGLSLDFSTIGKFDFLSEEVERENLFKANSHNPYENRSTAFLTVQEGCDKFCTFCVVPYTRGPEHCRSVNEIYREALKLVSEGVKEINLLGQNVNAYRSKDSEGNIITLGKLADMLAKIPGLERIRYTTSHPRDVDDDLLDSHKHNEKLMPFVHLPIQSGSDRILNEMNRKHTADEYRRIIDRFREARHDIEFSSDFIVGYPNESDEDFLATMKLVEDVKFSLSYSFIYSARPGTKAATIQDNIPAAVKTVRLMELQKLLESQMSELLIDKVGKTLPVLISRRGKFDNHFVGFTPYMQPVIVEDAHNHFNQIIDVEISSSKERALKGKIINSPAKAAA